MKKSEIPKDDRAALIKEVSDRMNIRMAVVMAPAMKILDLSADTNLRPVIERFLGPLENDIAAILAAYDVKRKDRRKDR